jgi:WD40 repeat protein
LTSLAFSPDGQRIVAASDNGVVRVWSPATGLSLITMSGSIAHSQTVTFSPTGETIAAGGENVVQTYNSSTGQPLERIGVSGTATALAYGPKGKWIAYGTDRGTAGIINATNGQAKPFVLVAEPGDDSNNTRVAAVALSPDGKYLATGAVGDDSVRVFDANTGDAAFQPTHGHESDVSAVAFTPDGKYAVSGSFDKTVRLWKPHTGMPVGEPLNGQQDDVTAVVVTPDGRRMLSSGRDGTVHQWTGPSAWRDALCSKLTSNLSSGDWRKWVQLSGNQYQSACQGLPQAPTPPIPLGPAYKYWRAPMR